MNDGSLDQRLQRILRAVAVEPTDRIPVVLCAAGWCARVAGLTLADYCSDSLRSAQAAIAAFAAIETADAMEYVAFDPALLSYAWMTKVRIPGVDQPADELWQVEESGLMEPADYDRIVADGWDEFQTGFIAERVGPEIAERAAAYESSVPAIIETVRAAGMPYLMGGADAIMPFEYLCGGRSFSQFVYDLYRIPDKVEAAMQAMMPQLSGPAIEAAKATGSPAFWVGGWRGASEMLARPLWERFVFPYHKQLVEEVVAAGLIPILHFDSDWTRDLARFREYPEKSCIMSLDGRTDIRKAKEILGDHMCLMGDVPAALLSRGTPDEVHDYVGQLVADIGPAGYIVHSGCDIPVDAPLDNVKAMVAAANDA